MAARRERMIVNSAADIERQAAGWLTRRDGGAWSAADQAALDRWIGEATAHRIAWLRLEAAWARADRLRASDLAVEPPIVEEIKEASPPLETRKSRQPARRMWLAMAAALVAAIGIPGYHYLNPPSEAFATRVGGFQQLPLDDGSRVDLNTDTALKVAYTRNERRVELARGEAFFAVAKDKSRPFVVHAGPYSVIAVGTAFTVRMEGDDVNVLVAEGRVRVEGPGKAGAVRIAFVAAGQAAMVAPAIAAPIVKPTAPEQIDAALSWRDGLLTFDEKPLGEVAAEFNRYNRRQLLVDPSAADVIVDGTFRATNVEGFVRLLRQGFDVQGVANGDNAILLKHL